MNSQVIYSIGYATKPIEAFIKQLKHHCIDVVADVRSVPYSNAFFDYHQDALIRHLRSAGIRYVYLGKELGPRSKDSAHYNDDGQVQFSSLMESDLFGIGVERIKAGLEKGYRIAFMCAEKDPAICHRSLLIAYRLDRLLNMDTVHILHDGNTELQSDLENRLMALTNIKPDMLLSENEATHQAYEMQCRCCAYVRSN